MDKIEQEYIINIEDTISNFRAELAADTQNVNTPTTVDRLFGNFSHGSGKTGQDLSLAWRKAELSKLHSSLVNNKELILDAIVSDYSIAREEAEIYEYNPVLFDIEKLISKYESWVVNDVDLASEELGDTTYNTLVNGVKSVFGASTGPQAKVINEPHGIALILGSQKSDFSCLLKPLIASIAAGNYNIVKPDIGPEDHYVTETDRVVTNMLKESLDPSKTLILDDDFNFMNLIENQ
jgi:acyl-CoA reductase-like NAD-dependent aldehyde dehydrogenase